MSHVDEMSVTLAGQEMDCVKTAGKIVELDIGQVHSFMTRAGHHAR